MSALDTRVFLFLNHAFARGWILAPMAVLSAIGGGWGALFAIPLFFSKRTRPMARALAGVLATTAVLVFGIKALVGRARPCNCLPDVHSLIFDAPTDSSFPSGHSAGSFSFMVFVAIILIKTAPRGASPEDRRTRIFRKACATVLVLIAVFVGLSRIALGVHFPGDVLAGAVIGTTIASLGAHLHLRANLKNGANLA